MRGRWEKVAARRAWQPVDQAELDRPESDADPEHLSFGRHVLVFFKELAAVVVGAIIVASLLRGFVGQMFLIPSFSMKNTLQVDDRVVVEKLGGIKRGQVVVFKDPGGWLTDSTARERGPIGKAFQFVGVMPDTSTEHLIKRVVGMPGDKVVCCTSKGRITVNGHPLDERSYLYTDPDDVQVNPSDIKFEVVVPKDRIFVMGDHRDLSADSRCHLSDLSTNQGIGQAAFVPMSLVVGPAFAIAAPFDRAERLRRPATFDKVPPPKEPAPPKAVIKPAGVQC